jgi:hypothetical protein
MYSVFKKTLNTLDYFAFINIVIQLDWHQRETKPPLRIYIVLQWHLNVQCKLQCSAPHIHEILGTEISS